MSAPATLAEARAQLEQQLQAAQTELKNIEASLQKGRGQTSLLSRRDTQLNSRLRQIETNPGSVSRDELLEIYKAAYESQVQVLTTRAQSDQLEQKRTALNQQIQQTQQLLDMVRLADVSSFSNTAQPTHDEPAATPQQTIIRIIDAQEKERQMLARQMHDGPASSLSNLVLQAEVVERLFDMDQARAREEIGVLKSSIQSAFQRIRDYIFNLRPMMLDDLGLLPTLRRFVQDYENKTKIASQLTIVGQDRRLPPHIEVIVFRIVQELLNNVQRHANAQRVQVSLDIGDDRVGAVVEDDGIGFAVQNVLNEARAQKTFGISNMLERVEMLGGQLQFDSTVGRGTRVELTLPAAG